MVQNVISFVLAILYGATGTTTTLRVPVGIKSRKKDGTPNYSFASITVAGLHETEQACVDAIAKEKSVSFSVPQGTFLRWKSKGTLGERAAVLCVHYLNDFGYSLTYPVSADIANAHLLACHVISEAPATEAPKTEAPKTEAPATEAPKSKKNKNERGAIIQEAMESAAAQ